MRMTSVSLSWTLLLVALFIMTKRFASTRGAPCHNDTRGSLKEIQKQLGRLQLQVKILKENKRTRICKLDHFPCVWSRDDFMLFAIMTRVGIHR